LAGAAGGTALDAMRTLDERNPLRFWQVVSALLGIALLRSFLRH
jgi:hypothetical protein